MWKNELNPFWEVEVYEPIIVKCPCYGFGISTRSYLKDRCLCYGEGKHENNVILNIKKGNIVLIGYERDHHMIICVSKQLFSMMKCQLFLTLNACGIGILEFRDPNCLKFSKTANINNNFFSLGWMRLKRFQKIPNINNNFFSLKWMRLEGVIEVCKLLFFIRTMWM